MAGHLEDPTQWRLRTNGGVPYKLKSLEGEFEFEKAGLNVNMLIASNQLFALMAEMFPPPTVFGDLTIPQYAKYGTTNLGVKRVRFKSFDDNLPIDPFNLDGSAPAGTYFPVLELDVEVGSTPFGSKKGDDPFTFLEISADASGEFIHSPPTAAMTQEAVPNTDTLPNGAFGPLPRKAFEAANKPPKPLRVPNIPHTMLVPQTTWSVGWKRLFFENFRDVIRPRLEYLLGKVNSAPFTILYGTWPTTLLFLGYSYKYNYTWRDGYVDKPFVDLDLKFLEKVVIWDGVVRGHQDIWRPGKGWDRLVLKYDRTTGVREYTYQEADFNILFAKRNS